MSRGPHGSFSFSRPEETKAGGSLTSRLTMPPTSGERRWVCRNTDGGSLQSQKPCPNNVFSERETKGQRVKNRRSKKKKPHIKMRPISTLKVAWDQNVLWCQLEGNSLWQRGQWVKCWSASANPPSHEMLSWRSSYNCTTQTESLRQLRKANQTMRLIWLPAGGKIIYFENI